MRETRMGSKGAHPDVVRIPGAVMEEEKRRRAVCEDEIEVEARV